MSLMNLQIFGLNSKTDVIRGTSEVRFLAFAFPRMVGGIKINLRFKKRRKTMAWADMKMQELNEKGRENWDEDDYEAYCYCQECFAEDEADAEYLGNFDYIY